VARCSRRRSGTRRRCDGSCHRFCSDTPRRSPDRSGREGTSDRSRRRSSPSCTYTCRRTGRKWPRSGTCSPSRKLCPIYPAGTLFITEREKERERERELKIDLSRLSRRSIKLFTAREVATTLPRTTSARHVDNQPASFVHRKSFLIAYSSASDYSRLAVDPPTIPLPFNATPLLDPVNQRDIEDTLLHLFFVPLSTRSRSSFQRSEKALKLTRNENR